MQVKQIIINGFIFLAVTAGLYLLALVLLLNVKVGGSSIIYRVSDGINWKGGNTYRKFREFNKDHNYDIIVIGSSHAYRGYDPRIFKQNGIDLFNLGTSAQSVMNSYFIAKEYIKPSNCKLAILELYDGSMASDGIEPTSDLVQNITSDRAALSMSLAIKDPRGVNMFAVRSLTKNKDAMYSDSAYVINGFSERKDTVKIVQEKWYKTKIEINEMQVNYLRKLIEYFKENKINVIMVSHPAPKETYNEQHHFFLNEINKIKNEFKVDYLDYSNSHDLNTRTDFYDTHHLNQSGVNKFNDMLIKDLKKMSYFSGK